MITVVTERMSDEFTKFHINGLPFPAVIHHFTGSDKGLPHDHPWGFLSFVLSGGYIERIYQRTGSFHDVHRRPGDTFRIAATHIHEIIELPQGECWTLVLPQPWERHGGFWDFSQLLPKFIPFQPK